MGQGHNKPAKKSSSDTQVQKLYNEVSHLNNQTSLDHLSKYLFIKDEELDLYLDVFPTSSTFNLREWEPISDHPDFNNGEKIFVFIHQDGSMSGEKIKIIMDLQNVLGLRLFFWFIIRSDIQFQQVGPKFKSPCEVLNYSVDYDGTKYNKTLDTESRNKLLAYFPKLKIEFQESQNRSSFPVGVGHKVQNDPEMPTLNCLLVLDKELESKDLLKKLISQIHQKTKKITTMDLCQLVFAKLDSSEFDCVFVIVHQDGRILDRKQSNLSLLDKTFEKRLVKCVVRRSDIAIGEMASIKFDKTVAYHISYDSNPYVAYMKEEDEKGMINHFLSCIDNFENEKKKLMKTNHKGGEEEKPSVISNPLCRCQSIQSNKEQKYLSYIKYLEKSLDEKGISYNKITFV